MDRSTDRRQQSRFDKVFAVYINGAWGTAFGIARNISRGGMFIETPDPYPLGSRMEITFNWPGSSVELTTVGEVIHVCFVNTTPGGDRRSLLIGMGVRFTGLLQLQADLPAATAKVLH